MVVKPFRHVVGVHELSDEEVAELGPLLRATSRIARELTGADQVYNCLWSRAGGRPGHVHYVVQPVTAEQIAAHDAHGPALQVAMFVENESLDPDAVRAFAERARRAFDLGSDGPWVERRP